MCVLVNWYFLCECVHLVLLWFVNIWKFRDICVCMHIKIIFYSNIYYRTIKINFNLQFTCIDYNIILKLVYRCKNNQFVFLIWTRIGFVLYIHWLEFGWMRKQMNRVKFVLCVLCSFCVNHIFRIFPRFSAGRAIFNNNSQHSVLFVSLLNDILKNYSLIYQNFN